MSGRYPTGMNVALFPHRFDVVTAATRDKYGKVATETTVKAAGRIDLRAVELMENGARTTRNGARILIASRPTFEVELGTIVKWKGKRWSIVSYNTTPSHQGEVYFYDCIAVEKATDK